MTLEHLACEKCRRGQEYWRQGTTISTASLTGGATVEYLGRLCCEHAVQLFGWGLRDHEIQ